MTVQIGNLACFIYGFFIQPRLSKRFAFVPIIGLLFFAPLVGILIALLWDTTTKVGKDMFSVALTSLSAASGLVGALSTVTLFPWASLYGATMVAAVSSGSGANGILAALLAVIQSPTRNPPFFSMEVYFIVLSAICTLSAVVFVLIQLVPGFERWKTMNITSAIVNDKHSLFATVHADDDDYLEPSRLTDSFKNNFDSTQNYRHVINGGNDALSDAEEQRRAYNRSTAQNNAQIGNGPAAPNRRGSSNVTTTSLLPNSGEDTAPEDFVGSDDPVGGQRLLSNADYLEESALDTPDYFHRETPNEVPTRQLLWIVRSPIMYQFYINSLYFLILGMVPFAFGKLAFHHAKDFIFWTNIVGLTLGAVGRLATFRWRYFYPRLFSIVQTPFFAFVFIMCFVTRNYSVPEIANYFIVVTFGAFSFLYGYADTINFQYPLVLLEGFEEEIQRGSRWVALANQVGSCLGSMIGFTLTMTYFT